MKIRPRKLARHVTVRRRFALHPLSFAVCLAMSGTALALPQGGTVVAGNATISHPSSTTELIRQSTDKAIIDWKSFSIAAGEKVRFAQPSDTSITLNRVTGYDPSYILGQMSSNGKIFLVNPYGVVFGAGARVDVGGIVVSSLSIADNDFLAGRYSLTSADPNGPAQRGEVRNEGLISAPGGTVVLAGPSVTNTGTIVADGGRVGLVAANSASIDVEGDGLIFFQANATEATNRLAQLGRIQADGGTVEMRAAARGAFADTVLNMTGIVQARTLGTREGKVVIDGGSEGIVHVAGTIDVSGRGAGERGGAAIIQGNEVTLDSGARVDASGDMSGGAIRIGGGFHGADTGVRNAANTGIESDAQLSADAVTRGNGGTVVVWADGNTVYRGNISARGGSEGGDGGFVEVSGKGTLAFQGLVDTRAPKGQTGSLLLDPTDITISSAVTDPGRGDAVAAGTDTITFGAQPVSNLNTGDLQIALNSNNVVVDTTSGLAGTGTLMVQNAVSWANANSLTLRADSTLTVNAGATITNTGTGSLIFNTNAGVLLNAAVLLSGGSFSVADKAGAGRAASFVAGAGADISTSGGAGSPGGAVNIQTTGAITTQAITTSGGSSAAAGNAAGSVTLSSNGGAITTSGAINALGGAAGGANQNGGAGGSVAITANGLASLAANVATTGGAPTGAGTKGGGGSIAVQGNGVTVAAALNVDVDDSTITVNGGAGAVQLNTSTLTTTSNGANAIAVRNATTVALGNLSTGASGTTTIGIGADVTGAVTQPGGTITTGTLLVSTAGPVTLGGANSIANLGTVARGGAFTLNDIAGGLTLTGDVGTAAASVSITTAGGALDLNSHNITTTTGTGTLTLAGAGVTQTTGSLVIGGASSINAGAGSIALQSATNDFGGPVTLLATGANAAVQSANDLTLAAPTLGNTNLSAVAGGTLNLPAIAIDSGTGSITLRSQGGPLAMAGTLTTNGGAVTLSGSAGLSVTDDITTAGGNISLTGGPAAGLAISSGKTVSAGAGTISLDGGSSSISAIALSDSTLTTTNNTANAVTIHNGTAVTLGNINATSGTVQIGVGGDVTGAVTQTGGTTLSADTLAASTSTAAGSINLGTGTSTLTITNLGDVQRGGTLTINDSGAGLALSGDIVAGTTTNTVSLTTAGGALALGAHKITTTGAGDLVLNGVDVTQTAAGKLLVGGNTTVNAGAGLIDLQSPTNHFTGLVDLSATGSAAIEDAAALQINSFSGNGITAIAGTTLSVPAGAIVTAGGAINLQALGGPLSTTGVLNSGGGAITLVGTAGLTVNQDVLSGNSNGAVSLTGGGAGLVVASGKNVNAGAGTITLDGGAAPIQLNASTLTTTNNTANAVVIHNATTVALGNITAITGTVQIGTAGDVTHAVTQTGVTALSADTLAASTSTVNGSIDLGSAGTLTVAKLGPVQRGGALTINDSAAGGLVLSGDIGGTAAAANTSITSAGALDLGPHSITTGAGNNLALVGVGVSQLAGSSLTVGGATSVDAGSGSIALQVGSNDFTGPVTLVSTGTSVAVSDINDMTLAGVNGGPTNLTALAGGTLTLPGGLFTTAGSIDLRSNGGALATNGDLISSGGGSISLTGSAGLTIGHNLNATSIFLNSTNSLINQTAGTITSAGATTFSAGSGNVTLARPLNDFNSIGGSGGAVTITDAAGTLALDAINATSLAVTTTAVAGDITQNGAATVTNATTVATSGGTVALTNPGNNFGSVGVTAINRAVSIIDINALALDAISAGSLTIDTHAGNGAVTQNGAAVVTGPTSINAGSGTVSMTQGANALGSIGVVGGTVSVTEGSASGVALDAINATSLTVTTTAATGDIVQTAAATVALATTIATSGGKVLLTNPGNNFGSVGVTALGADVSIADAGPVALDAIHAGKLTIDTHAGNGAVTQNAAAIVTSVTTINSGTGAITLNNPGNDFSNLPGNTFTGGAISLRDSNDLMVSTLASGPNQAVSVIAGLSLTLPPGSIVTGAADLTLSSGGGPALATPGSLSGHNISLTGANGVTIGNDVNASHDLNLSTNNHDVTQNAGSTITAGNVTTVTAGTGNVTLAQPLNDFNSINVVSGNNVSINDSNALTVAALASGALTITSGGVLTSGGALSGTSVALTGNGGISLGANVSATTSTLRLATTNPNAPVNQTAGAISATAGLTTVNAGSGDITLNQPGNDFSNAFGINASGAAVRITDANSLFIAGLSVGSNKDLSLTAVTGSVSGLSLPIDTGSADLAISAGAGFTTFAALRGTNVTLGGGVGGISLGDNVTALGNLTLTALNSAINQTAGSITAASGTTTANAGTGPITLNRPGNNFATFAATGGAVTVRDDNGLVLGPISATGLTIDSSVGNGTVTQSGAAIVTGTTTVTAGGGDVTLSNAGNNFANIGVSGRAVSITDINALALNAINATGLTIDTSAGNGNVTQTAAAIVSGATAVNAGTGTIALVNPGNNFGSVGANGSVVSITDVNALALDAINATTLTLNTGGAITQNAGAVVTAATTANAGANDITLNNAGNNFASVGATGGIVAITNVNALALDAINATGLTIDTSAGNGNVTQNAAAIVGGPTTVTAGSGAVTLTNPGNNFASVSATGGAVSIKDINAVALGAINASSLTVDTSAGNGAVTQTAAVIVANPSVINAGAGAVTLGNAGNDFSTLGVTGGAVTIVDSNALTLSTLASAPNRAVNVSAGGALTLPASAMDAGAASLTLASGGTLTTVGTLRGTNVVLNSGAAMTIGNDVTALGTLGLTAANAPITQNSGTITAGGATTVNAGSGDIALARLSNDFQGPVALTGGAISVHDTNNLTVSSIASGANKPVSLVAGGTLVLPAVPIDTGTADLTLQALGGSLAINGALSGNSVTVTGSAGLTLGANVTSSGAQIYTTPVQLSANVSLDAGASKIDLQGGANGGGHDLALTSSNAAADAIHSGAPIANTAQFTVTGNSTLGGNVTTTGNQTYTGTVALGGDVTLDAGAAKVDLKGAVDAAGHNLGLTSSNAAADAVRAEAAIGNAAQVTVTGKSTLASGVGTTGAQLYSDTVTLGSSSNFSGSSLGFGNGIVAAAFDLGLSADTLNLVGAVTGSGNATLSSATQSSTVGVAGGAGTLQIAQATLDRFASFAKLTVGRADGTGDLTFGNLVLPTNFAVQSATGNANFTGTVASAAAQSRDLTVSTGGATTFAGAVGGANGGAAALGNLSVSGATNLNASTTTNGTQTFAGPLTAGADATLWASAIAFGNSLDVGNHAVTLLTDALGIAGSATGAGAGNVQLAPQNASGSIGVTGGAGTLQVSQGLLNTLAGVPTLTLGRADGTAAVTVGNVILPASLAIVDGAGDVAFTGTVDSAAGPPRDVSVTTTGTSSFSGAVGGARPVGALTVSGASQLGGSIVSSGAQTFTGPTTLLADSTLTAPSVSFGSTVDGARSLTVNAAATQFGAAVGAGTALTSLTTDAAGTTQLGGNVTTSGAQTYSDALSLNADAALTGSTLNLAGSIDGAHTLAVNGSTGVTLGQAIGATTPLAGLSVTGPLQLNAGSVTTTGAQSYAGATTLGATTTLTAPSISFGNGLDGAFALTLQSAGPTSFAGAVGATTPLASLAANGGGAVQLSAPSIETSGAQSYSGALQLGGSARLTGSALTLIGPVSGATDLTLQTNALTGGNSISGSGTLTIQPIDPTLSIGVAGGSGSLQVAQSVLTGATGFTSHVIGNAGGSGTISVGNLTLVSDTTLQTATGDINLGGSVDGAHALTLNSGGTTRITGPIGVTTPLTSLTTDNNAAAPDWNGTSGERTTFDTADGSGAARIVTTGAQTYNDPVTASVPISFTGGAITAAQATSSFDKTVSAIADSLQLKSSGALTLGGTVMLANGGNIEAAGVLHLNGALQLNGGTLVLTSDAPLSAAAAFNDPTLPANPKFGGVTLNEASAAIVQDGGTINSATGSLLVLRSPSGGSILLDRLDGNNLPVNQLLGTLSAVSGQLNDAGTRFGGTTTPIDLGFIRIASSEIHVAGKAPSDGDQTVLQAGLEGDVIKLTADVLTTGADGLIRARLPFNSLQGSTSSIPALTFVLTPTALAAATPPNATSYGSTSADTFIQIQIGSAAAGGFITARAIGAPGSGSGKVIFLGGGAEARPFYDGNGKLTEIRIFYNGDAPRTPQEAGALAAVIAIIEEARHARFEEAVRTENVSSRLRSGVIAEVGAGRPATVGRESIRLPESCDIKAGTLRCE